MWECKSGWVGKVGDLGNRGNDGEEEEDSICACDTSCELIWASWDRDWIPTSRSSSRTITFDLLGLDIDLVGWVRGGEVAGRAENVFWREWIREVPASIASWYCEGLTK